MNQRTRAGVESNLEDQPPSGRKPQEIKRENWQHERGVIADQNCADGFGVVCCARGIVSIESKTYTHALGDAEGCVWCKKPIFRIGPGNDKTINAGTCRSS